MSWREQELLQLLDDVSATAETLMTHYGDKMPEHDRINRSRLILRARTVCDRMLRPETARQ